MPKIPSIAKYMLSNSTLQNLLKSLTKGQTLRLGVLYMGVGALISMTLSYGFNILAGRILGPAGYGLISILFSLVITISSFFFMGGSRTIAKYTADLEAKEQPLYPVVIAGLKVHLILIGLLILLGILYKSTITYYVFDGNQFLTYTLIISVALYGISMLIGGVLQGMRELHHLSFYRLAQPLSRFICFVLLVALSVDYLIAAGIAQIALPLVGLWSFFPLYRYLRYKLKPVSATFPILAFLGFSIPATLLQGSGMFLVNLAPLLAKWIAVENANALAGSMTAALLIIRGPLFLFQALFDSLFPYASRAVATQNYQQIRQYVSKGTQFSLLVMFLIMAVVFSLGENVVKLVFGPEFSSSKIELSIFALFAVFYFLNSLLTNILMVWKGLWPLFLAWAIGILVTILFSLWGPVEDTAIRIEVGLALGGMVTWAMLSIRYYLAVKWVS